MGSREGHVEGIKIGKGFQWSTLFSDFLLPVVLNSLLGLLLELRLGDGGLKES